MTRIVEFLTSEKMKLLGSPKSKIRQDENDENVFYLEITEVILVHCNIFNNSYQHDSRVLYAFITNKLVNYQIFHPKLLSFKKLLIKNFHISKYGLLIKTLNYQRQKTKKYHFSYQLKCKIEKTTRYSVQPRDQIFVMSFCLLLRIWVKILVKI